MWSIEAALNLGIPCVGTMAYSAAGNAVLPALVSSYISTVKNTTTNLTVGITTTSSSLTPSGKCPGLNQQGDCQGSIGRRLLSLFGIQTAIDQQADNRDWLPVGGLGSDRTNAHTAGVLPDLKYVQGQGHNHDGQPLPGTNAIHAEQPSAGVRSAGTTLGSALAGLSGGLEASSHMQSAAVPSAGGTVQQPHDGFYHHQDLAAIEGASSYHRALLQASATNALNPNAPPWDWVGLVVLGVFFAVIGLYLASHAYKKHKLAR